MAHKIQLKSLFREELTSHLVKLGEPSYRTEQILHWTYPKAAISFDAMSNLSVSLRQKLSDSFELNAVHSLQTRHASDTTEKFLFQLNDGSLIESVLIPATPGLTSISDRHTLCISTQVGCAYGCKFCASGLDGVKRNLSAAEIVDQVIAVERIKRDEEKKPSSPEVSSHKTQPFRVDNIVVMGMGEPLANYDNLMRALKIINAPWGLGIGARKITVSTVGLVPRIMELAEEPMQLRLAVSLHGATDDVRERIMPVNKKYPLKELLSACDYYCNTKKRMMTFEYILIEGVNDTIEQAHKLAAIAKRLRSKINLIPYNPVESLPWVRPSRDRCKTFQHILRDKRVDATLRMEKGTDINAACGQLRLKTKKS